MAGRVSVGARIKTDRKGKAMMDYMQHLYDRAYNVLRCLYEDADGYVDEFAPNIERWCIDSWGKLAGGEAFIIEVGYNDESGDVFVWLDTYTGTITARYENDDSMEVRVIIPDSINKAARKAFEYHAYASGAISSLAETINPAW